MFRRALFAAALLVLGCSNAEAFSGGSVCDWLFFNICATVDSNHNLHVLPAAGSSGSGTLAYTVSGAAESNHNVKAAAAAFYDAYVTTGSTAGYLLILDAASDPGNGAVTPVHCIQAPANVTVGYSTDGMPPEQFNTGIELIFSTTGCFTETKSATAFFHARAN